MVGKTTLIRSFFEENSIKFVEINLHDNQSALEAFNTSKDSKELLVKIIALADKNVEDGMVIPLEIKSGKDYKRHSALNNLIEDFNVKKAYVFNNDNISIKNERIYVPIYMIMFIQKKY